MIDRIDYARMVISRFVFRDPVGTMPLFIAETVTVGFIFTGLRKPFPMLGGGL